MTVHVVFVVVVHRTTLPAIGLGIELLHVHFLVILRNHGLFLGRQKFLKLWNNCRVYRVGEFHIELNDELALFKGITVCGHAFAKDAFQVSGLNAFARNSLDDKCPVIQSSD